MSIKTLKKNIDKKIKNKYTTDKILEVGFLGGKYPNGVKVASVAFWNEYGTIKIPPRPFFRNAITNNNKKWVTFLKEKAKETSINNAFNQTGELIRGDIVKSITKTTTPTNSLFTIMRKGSTHPLIDTGFMRASVSYQIKGK